MARSSFRAIVPAVLTAPLVAVVFAGAPQHGAQCAPDNAGITVPDGFCVQIVADGLGRARHLAVAGNGDVFVAVQPDRQGGAPGGVVVLRDTTGDGVADVMRRFGEGVGDAVAFHGGYLYYATNDAVVRYAWPEGALEPAGPAETIVSGLPAARGHRAKSIAIGEDGSLFVNIGSLSNACQEPDRQAGVPGRDPCVELETRAGIWRFDADRRGQTQQDGVRWATGLRNTVALAVRPQDRALYGVVHGRDQLALWTDYFDDAANAELPAEEFARIDRGADLGWPYCYYDPQRSRKVLAPEYGGDGEQVGRCEEKTPPLIAFPAHWAPNGLLFYAGTQFPPPFRGGAFVAFHGSWNRAPEPQAGYNVAFARFVGDEPRGDWTVFADGFAGADVSPGGAAHRPVGLAEGPDGSLYVSDDSGGRIYRILFRPGGR